MFGMSDTEVVRSVVGALFFVMVVYVVRGGSPCAHFFMRYDMSLGPHGNSAAEAWRHGPATSSLNRRNTAGETSAGTVHQVGD